MAGNLNAIFHLNVPLYPGCLSWSLFRFWEITKRAVKPRGYVTNLALHAILVPCEPGKNDKGRYRSLRVRFRPLIPTGHKSASGTFPRLTKIRPGKTGKQSDEFGAS